MIKVMIVDDQVLLKETLLYMLSQDDEIEAIDGGSNGYEAIEICERHNPDVILLDLRMPKLDGIETIKKIKNMNKWVKIIVLTTFEDDKGIIKSIENGADGYLVKDLKPETLILAVKGVFNDLHIIHESVLNLIKDKIIENTYDKDPEIKTINRYNLSLMELEVIRLMVDGKSNREIATELNFTEGTIKNKVSKILSKLGVKDRTQIAVFAIKHNLV